MNNKIFISYRRDDSKKITDQIYKELIANFGEKNIFRDLDILAGQDFPDELKKALSTCSVMLVIIGNTWLSQVNPNGEPRLKAPDDWVRLEIATVLARKNIESVKIIPILVNEAKMPTTDQLRQFELQKLAECMALAIRKDKIHFDSDIDRLIVSILQATSYQIPIQLQKELSQISDQIASTVNTRIDAMENNIEHRLNILEPPSTSLRLVGERRSGFEGFFRCIISRDKDQTLFFAGRSVLHRIEDDLKDRGWGAQVEDVLINKLNDGATIHILFLDPRSDLINRIEESQGENTEQVLADIARSICICRRLFKRLQNEVSFGRNSNLDIRLYDQIPYFSYHKDNEQVFLGFYLSTGFGNDSAVFEAEDMETKRFFGDHITQVFNTAISLVRLPNYRRPPIFNEQLLEDITASLSEKLGIDRAEKLLCIDSAKEF